MLKLGSHVSMASPNYLVGALQESNHYGANAFMIYSGAPQNTRRTPVDRFKIEEAHQMMEESGFDRSNIIMHAPYIINLANTIKPETFELATSFLSQEIIRTQAIGSQVIVLHPGAHVKAGVEAGIAQIIRGLNSVLNSIEMEGVVIALETMAGKGTEIGRTFEELKAIYDGIDKKESIGFCLDTCHLHDAGYDLNNIDGVLDEFDRIIGLDKIAVVHVNDSKNVRGAGKDRHENIGFGQIGFENLMSVIHHPSLSHLCKILETPFVDGRAPYKHEIEMIKSATMDWELKEKV